MQVGETLNNNRQDVADGGVGIEGIERLNVITFPNAIEELKKEPEGVKNGEENGEEENGEQLDDSEFIEFFDKIKAPFETHKIDGGLYMIDLDRSSIIYNQNSHECTLAIYNLPSGYRGPRIPINTIEIKDKKTFDDMVKALKSGATDFKNFVAGLGNIVAEQNTGVYTGKTGQFGVALGGKLNSEHSEAKPHTEPAGGDIPHTEPAGGDIPHTEPAGGDIGESDQFGGEGGGILNSKND